MKYLVNFKPIVNGTRKGGWIEGYGTAARAKEVVAKVMDRNDRPWDAVYLGSEKKYYEKGGKG